MFRHILVPVTVCGCSQQAAHYAVRFSRLLGGGLIYLYLPAFNTNPTTKHEAKVFIDDLPRNARPVPRLRVISSNTKTHHGNLPALILKVAQVESVGLIIMGTHGCQNANNDLQKMLSSAMAELSNIPVLIVPFNIKDNNSLFERWQQALTDDTNASATTT